MGAKKMGKSNLSLLAWGVGERMKWRVLEKQNGKIPTGKKKKKRQELYSDGSEYSFCFMFVHWRSQGQDKGGPVTPMNFSDISSGSCLNK